MSTNAITCPQCGKHYPFRAELIGKRVKCAACGNSFTFGPNLAGGGALSAPASAGQATPVAQAQPVEGGGRPQSLFQFDPERGPTDLQFRVGSVVVNLLAVPVCAIVAMQQAWGLKEAFVFIFTPFVFCFGVAALVDPNIARAAGKYGAHLPAKYKLVAALVGLVALAISGGLAYWLYLKQAA